MRSCVAAVCFLLACGAAACAADSTTQDGSAQEDDLTAKLTEELSLPLPELSGLTRRYVDDQLQLLAIGDSALEILSVRATTTRWRDAAVESVDVSSLFAPYVDASKGSQWEAIAADGDGRVVILEESPGRLFVLDPMLHQLERVLELHVVAGDGVSSSLAKSWRKNENARGEGLILLRNGHVLVLKERDERALIEFGPEGEVASGYRVGDAATDVAFPLPVANELYALRAWSIDHAKSMPDGSELALDADGELYVLSDEGRALARVELPLEPSADQAHVGKRIKLPSVTEPEGLCALDEGTWLVVSDQKKTKNNAAVVRP